MSQALTPIKLPLCALALVLAAIAPATAIAASQPRAARLRKSGTCSPVATKLSEWAARQAVQQFAARRFNRLGSGYRLSGSVGRAPRILSMASPSFAGAGSSRPRRLSAASPASAGRAKATTMMESFGPAKHTGTNVQEVGVDEADLVKTDGKYIYVVNDGEVLIMKSWPADETAIIARLSLPDNAVPSQLYLHGKSLVVLSTVRIRFGGESTGLSAGTRITYIDIANRVRPTIERHVDLEGAMLQSRLIGSDLYLVSQAGTRLPASLLRRATRYVAREARGGRNMSDPESVIRRVAKYLAKSLTRAEIDRTLPRMRSRRIGGQFQRLLSCGDLYAPSTETAPGILTLTHLRLNRHEPPHTQGVLAHGSQVYASDQALYVADGSTIHKFDLNGGSRGRNPTYTGSGEVSGRLLNQFAMSEHNGFLRVATTDGSGNNLWVMKDYGRWLEVVGAVTGLARGERIYAVRMFGNKGYVVTFRRTDPLYTLDLSDPYQPGVVGELKINGFSSYIHPLDNNRLLTIGQDATSSGRVQGVHLQIFDVSDPANPRRVHQELVAPEGGRSQSIAQNDHHALTFDPATRTLAVPVNFGHRSMFSGLYVYRIDPGEGFAKLGLINHNEISVAQRRERCIAVRDGAFARLTIQQQRRMCRAPAPATMLRSIVMDQYLYSLSSVALEVHNLRNLDAPEAAVLLSGTTITGARVAAAGRRF